MSEKDPDATLDLPTLASAEALAVVPGYALIRMRAESDVTRCYECRSERLGENVLVYVLRKDVAEQTPRKNRILRDSRLLTALRTHPNLQRVLEVGEGAAGPYIIVEQPDAEPLAVALEKNGRLSVLDALTAVHDAAQALVGAHGAGVVHRDLTPHTLLRAKDGTLKVGGFGFAAPIVAEGAPAGLVGTPEVIAPELVKGGEPDARSDIYALGATLFWLITGKPIFSGSAADVLAAQQKKPVPSISSLVPDAGITVVDILYRLLQKDPTRRPQTAADVVTLLEGAVARMQRESGLPSPAQTGGFGVTPSSSAYAAPPRAPATKVQSRTEMAQVPATGSSPFDAASTEGDPYVGQPTGVLGSLKQMSVTEILQTLEIGKKSARVDVQSVDGEKGTLHVHDGNIVHCSTANASGEPAVAVLIKKKEGFFRIHYEKEPCEKNISRPTQFVLLEAMRAMDEAASAPPAAAPAPASARSSAPTGPKPSTPDTQTTQDILPHARTVVSTRGVDAPPVQAAAPVVHKDAVVVRRPPAAERPALAKPLEEAAPPVGDGLERDPSATHDQGLEDATSPAIPTAAPQWQVAAQRAWRTTRTKSAELVSLVKRRAPVWNADLEERFAPLRPQLSRVHPRLGTVPLWQLMVATLTVLWCLVLVVGAILD